MQKWYFISSYFRMGFLMVNCWMADEDLCLQTSYRKSLVRLSVYQLEIYTFSIIFNKIISNLKTQLSNDIHAYFEFMHKLVQKKDNLHSLSGCLNQLCHESHSLEWDDQLSWLLSIYTTVNIFNFILSCILSTLLTTTHFRGYRGWDGWIPRCHGDGRSRGWQHGRQQCCPAWPWPQWWIRQTGWPSCWWVQHLAYFHIMYDLDNSQLTNWQNDPLNGVIST